MGSSLTRREERFQEGSAHDKGREAGKNGGAVLGAHNLCKEAVRDGAGRPVEAVFWRALSTWVMPFYWNQWSVSTLGGFWARMSFPICPLGGITWHPQAAGRVWTQASRHSEQQCQPLLSVLRRTRTKKGLWDLSMLLPGNHRGSSFWHRWLLPAGRLPGRPNRGCHAACQGCLPGKTVSHSQPLVIHILLRLHLPILFIT